MNQKVWFTPAGIEDLLPEQAKPLEIIRRQLLDGFDAAGYELVLPPIAEYTDSLLTGTANLLEKETCRFTDQETGKMMGVRADMTPQVARLVANRFPYQKGIIRLCYVGEVLRAHNNKAKGSRSPIQIGAELFGDSGVESDLEVIELMLESITQLGLNKLNLSLGHVGIVNELFMLANLSETQKTECVDILQRKAIPEYQVFVASLSLTKPLNDAFMQLIQLTGNASEVIEQAQMLLASISKPMAAHVTRLVDIVTLLKVSNPTVEIHLDLADLRGYSYHTGIIFSCYSLGKKLYPIARGGRYDRITQTFGDSKPATGFSTDLRSVMDLATVPVNNAQKKVFIPTVADTTLMKEVSRLKSEGYRVIKHLSNSTLPEGSQRLEKQSSGWVLVQA